MTNNPDQLKVDSYADGDISEYHNMRVPRFLKITYLLVSLLVVFWGYMYWNGSTGWLDRGAWSELQSAANTKSSRDPFWAEKAVQRDADWRPDQRNEN